MLFIAGCSFAAASPALSAVLTPTTVSGSNAIDPSGEQTVDTAATGSTSAATLEAITGFQSVQSFTGFDPTNVSTTNIFSLADASVPDFRTTFAGSYRSGSAPITGTVDSNTRANSSSGNAISLSGNTSGAGATFTFTIDFGNYSGSSFDGTVNPVAAAGFTINNIRSGVTFTVAFQNEAGTALSTQSIIGSDEATNDGIDGYFGLLVNSPTLANSISRIVVTKTATGNGNQTMGIDDIGFGTVVPEPGTLSLLALAVLPMLRRRRA